MPVSPKTTKRRRRAPRAHGRHRVSPDPLAQRIGQRIRALRTAADFGFDAFVEETALGRGYVSELERGLVIPTIGTLARVAAALDVTLGDLVNGESERERLFSELRDADPKLIRELRELVAKRSR
jgi:transcriptional regulator with XRE-family HTH domain